MLSAASLSATVTVCARLSPDGADCLGDLNTPFQVDMYTIMIWSSVSYRPSCGRAARRLQRSGPGPAGPGCAAHSHTQHVTVTCQRRAAAAAGIAYSLNSG